MSASFTVFLGSITGIFLALAALLIAYRAKRWVVAPFLVLAALPPGFVAFGAWGQGFRSLSELDLNGDGSTSLVEIVTAMDVVITRSPERPDCKEYLDAKTGAHVYKTRCPSVCNGSEAASRPISEFKLCHHPSVL